MESNFGDFFRQKRQEKGLTQKNLADLLFITESTVSKWENNVAHPDITLLPKIAKMLGVTEHEIITASIDKEWNMERRQAKKWRVLSFSWSLFFYISYGIALISCFICNLAIEHTLSWFWIVLSALLFSFTFTHLPRLVKSHKLILLPLSMLFALILLLAVCCAYTSGNWFWVASWSVILGFVIVFAPIYISKYKIFSKVKAYNDFVCLGVDFLFLNILLIVINVYTDINYGIGNWYLNIACPIVLTTYILLNIFFSVRFLKINKLLKTSLVLFMIDLLYTLPIFIRVDNPSIQKEIDDYNILFADFSNWQVDVSLDNNVHCIIFLTILFLAIMFLIFGLIKKSRRKK